MHSWRVLILPFLEQSGVYNAYNFDEPWDGPNNAKLASQVGNIFRRPEAAGDSAMTSFVAVVGPETVFPGARPMKKEDLDPKTVRALLTANGGEPVDVDGF